MCLVLAAVVAAQGLAAEPFPSPPPKMPAEISDEPRLGDWPAPLTEEEKAVVEHMEFLEMMELLENLDIIQNWDVVTNPLPSESETVSPPDEASSYGDLGPR